MRTKENKIAQLSFDAVPVIRFYLKGNFLSGNSIFRYEFLGRQLHNSSLANNINLSRAGKKFSGMYITLHDPAILPDMYNFRYYRLQRGKVMVVPFVKTVQRFNSHCMDYRTDHENVRPDELNIDALHGSQNLSTSLWLYRSRGECILYCLWRKQKNANKCVNFFSIFTLEIVQQAQFYRFADWLKEMTRLENGQIGSKADARIFGNNYPYPDDAPFWVKFCSRAIHSYKDYLKSRRQCLQICPPACNVENYAEQNVYNYKLDTKTNSSIVEVVWAPKPVTYVHHRSKLESSEFLGSLGGIAHIYLGLSIPYLINYVIKLIQWGEFLPQCTFCCVVTWWRSCFVPAKKKQTNIVI